VAGGAQAGDVLARLEHSLKPIERYGGCGCGPVKVPPRKEGLTLKKKAGSMLAAIPARAAKVDTHAHEGARTHEHTLFL